MRTSSVNSSPAIPLAVTMLGVSLRVIPMNPIFAPCTFWMEYDGRIVSFVPA